MSGIILPSRWRRQPSAFTEVNENHALARGLIFDVGGPWVRDSARGFQMLQSVAIEPRATPFGRGWCFLGGDDSYATWQMENERIPAAADGVTIEALTWFVDPQWLTTPVGLYQHVSALNSSSPATDGGLRACYLHNDSSQPAVSFWGKVNDFFTGTPVIRAFEKQHIIIVKGVGTGSIGIRVFVNGVKYEGNSTAQASFSTPGSFFSLGSRHPSGAMVGQHITMRASIRNYAVSDAEAMAMTEAPWQHYKMGAVGSTFYSMPELVRPRVIERAVAKSQPRRTPALNLDAPLSRGLVGLWVPSDKGMLQVLPVSKTIPLRFAGYLASSQRGVEITGGTTGRALVPDDPRWRPQSAITVIGHGQLPASTQVWFSTEQAGATAGFGIYGNRIYVGIGGWRDTALDAAFGATGSFGFTYDGSNVVAVTNGKPGNSLVASGSIDHQTIGLMFGARADASEATGVGTNNVFAIWDRALSQRELQEFHDNPWQLFRSQREAFYPEPQPARFPTVITIKRATQPQSAIDYAHPANARGVALSVNPKAGPIDLASGGRLIVNANRTPTRDGVAFQFHPGGGNSVRPPDGAQLTSASFLAVLDMDDLLNAETAYGRLFSFDETLSCIVGHDGATYLNAIHFGVTTSGGSLGAMLTNAITPNGRYVVACSWDGRTNTIDGVRFAVDGKVYAPNVTLAANGGTPQPNTANRAIGNRASDLLRTLDGRLSLFHMVPWAWPDAMLANLTRNPWQLFRNAEPGAYTLAQLASLYPTLSLAQLIDILQTSARPRVTITVP